VPVLAIVILMVVGVLIFVAYRLLANQLGQVGFNAETTGVALAPDAKTGGDQLIVKRGNGQSTVHAPDGTLLATFTDGARKVVILGPARTFAEPASTSAVVNTSDWVRLYPYPFAGTVDRRWLDEAIGLNNRQEPDVLAIAMQYVRGAPQIKDSQGIVIAGDASFGPGQSDGDRQEGSDFNDFMGITHNYANSVDRPEGNQYGSLDCSGFQRMVWGYRSGLPLELEPTGTAMPRRAYQILESAPGVTVAADTGRPLGGVPANLQTGDVLFFNVEADDGARVDHMAIYLGPDSEGSNRFISSRIVANGPTMGDIAGRSVIDGTGFFAKSFRAVRRF